MVVRKGKVRQPHFAHKQEGLCAEPDDVLHKTVQFLTVQAINDAVSCEQKYCLGYPCPDCKKDRSRDISPEVVEVKTERTVVKGTRSDIVVCRAGKPPVIIEVVVNHDLEPTTRDLYEDSGIPVFLIHPDWDNLNDFKQRVITTRTLNVDTGPCPGCVKKAENRRLAERRKRDQVLKELERLDEKKCVWSSLSLPRPWMTDRMGTILYPRIRRQLYAMAIILMEMGFLQSKKNPSIFWFGILDNRYCVYADLGWYYHPKDDIIWRDPKVLIECNVNEADEDFKSFLLNAVYVKLCDAELAAEAYETGKRSEYSGNNAEGLVDKRILDKLLAEADRNGHYDERL